MSASGRKLPIEAVISHWMINWLGRTKQVVFMGRAEEDKSVLMV